MRWIALLVATVGSVVLLLLLVLPPASALPVSGVRAALDRSEQRADAVLPVGANGTKSRWRKRCY